MIAHKKKSLLSRSAPYLLAIYCIAVSLFFMAELGWFGLDNHLRATNQVLVLFALLLLPFIVMNMPNFVQSLTLKVSDKEFHIQLNELQESITGNLGKVERQVGTVEQALWPMLAGQDVLSSERLSASPRKIIIGSKLDTSHLFFTELIAQMLSRYVTDIECEIRYPNGGSLRNFADVKFRWIDLYIDFTGTCCQYFNISHKDKDGVPYTDEKIVEELNRYGENINMQWLAPWSASENYCLTISVDSAEKHGVKTLQDLKKVAHKLTFTADPEFLNRKDCYLGLKEYGIAFKDVLPCHVSERYAALETEEAQVFAGYESDPQIVMEEVIKLEDTEKYFPSYKAVPLVSLATLKSMPEIASVLNMLADKLHTDRLNSAVANLAASGNSTYKAKEEVCAFIDEQFGKQAV